MSEEDILLENQDMNSVVRFFQLASSIVLFATESEEALEKIMITTNSCAVNATCTEKANVRDNSITC